MALAPSIRNNKKPQMLSRTPGAGSLLVATLFAAAPQLSSATLKAWKGATAEEDTRHPIL